MKPAIGITDKNRAAVADILNRVLADTVVLNVKTRNFHWNVTGSDFSELHKFFEAQYEELDAAMDEIAERVRALGGVTRASLKEFLAGTSLKESTGGGPAAKKMLSSLLDDHETVIQALRADVDACADKWGDMGTSDFITGLVQKHEKMAWMLRAYLT